MKQFLAEGRDPDTNAVLDPTLVLSRSYEAWFRFAATLLGKLPQGKDERKFDRKSVYLLQENISKIELSDVPVTARRLGELVNAVREPYGKKLTAVAVGAFFLEAGLTEEEVGRGRKVPTELGRQYGVTTEMRLSPNGIRYFVLLYGRAAQQLLLDNIERCINVLDVPLSVSSGDIDPKDLPWTEEDETARLSRL